ncbi:hypothetical protein [Halalkalibacterium ligniniphilum]|uniref:hypothetical protein n=1 Tax=Halalkalibacterium ligniniphilum TaxID=1134413 RepID=UPI00036B0414|nr:hypothetical protein [Halalkalibacterium ligniniphilum]
MGLSQSEALKNHSDRSALVFMTLADFSSQIEKYSEFGYLMESVFYFFLLMICLVFAIPDDTVGVKGWWQKR